MFRKILCLSLCLSIVGVDLGFAQTMNRSQSKRGRVEAPKTKFGGTVNNGDKETIEVSVTGAVARPGTYAILPPVRLTDGINIAEGFLSEGSRRQVVIKRRGKQVGKFDLVHFLINGDIKANPYLKAGDVVHVGYKSKVVRVYGPVRHQGEYDLVSESTFKDLIGLLQGYTTGFNPYGDFKVLRTLDGKQQTLVYSRDEIDNLALRNGDMVLVPHVTRKEIKYNLLAENLPGEFVKYPELEQEVFVVGGVRLPGNKTYYPHLTVREYISLAGGFVPLAKRNHIRIIPLNGEAKKIKYKHSDKIILNPGDAIDVDEKSIPPQFWITFMTTLASIGLTAFALLR
jgi:protein involved in polysaccharide export with SLBB domain